MVSFLVLMIIISRIDVMHKQFFDFFLFIYFSLICFIYIACKWVNAQTIRFVCVCLYHAIS